MFGSVLDAEHLFGRMRHDSNACSPSTADPDGLAGARGAAWAGPAVRALGSPEGPTRIARSSYVVREGDTLWTIARRLAPESDPRPIVDVLSTANGLEAGLIVPGQTLVVPLA